ASATAPHRPDTAIAASRPAPPGPAVCVRRPRRAVNARRAARCVPALQSALAPFGSLPARRAASCWNCSCLPLRSMPVVANGRQDERTAGHAAHVYTLHGIQRYPSLGQPACHFAIHEVLDV